MPLDASAPAEMIKIRDITSNELFFVPFSATILSLKSSVLSARDGRYCTRTLRLLFTDSDSDFITLFTDADLHFACQEARKMGKAPVISAHL